jgi:hypothetical protein
MENETEKQTPVGSDALVLPLPVLRDMHGQIIREFDILRVFHFYGRRRGKHREKHYMHKIAVVKDHKSPKYPKVWWFHHTAEMGEGLTNGYIPYSSGTGDQWAIDQTLDGVEVIDSPATLRDENEKRRIPQQNARAMTPATESDHGK